MFKVYFKQALSMLKQNKFISIIAIIGTALAIMMMMCLIIVDQLNNSNIAPESNRDRTLYINGVFSQNTESGAMSVNLVPFNVMKDYLSKLETPKHISIVSYEPEICIVEREGVNESITADMSLTDNEYWQILSFDFKSGEPFSRQESDAGIKNAVISEKIEKRFFKGEEAVGKTILINSSPYRVTGVVRDVSPVFSNAYSEIWLPYTSRKEYQNKMYRLFMLANKKRDFKQIEREVKAAAGQYSQIDTPWEHVFYGPDNQRSKDAWFTSDMEQRTASVKANNRRLIFILIILILVPAVNLSSFSMSRIKKRTAEIGIRKAFGAKKYIILIQVLFENFITSIIGGIIGLLFSYVVISQFRFWLLGISEDSTLPISAFVSVPVILAVFLACLIINLLSAGIPAYRASRMSIVNSLNQNDR